VAKVFERVYLEHKDAIIACFKNISLSLLVDGSKDHLLKIQDCPNLTIRDWQQAPKGTKDTPILINDNIRDTIKVEDNDNSLLYTAQEVAKGITIKVKDKNNITTNLGVSSNEAFDPDS
jgi:hypothetical protein